MRPNGELQILRVPAAAASDLEFTLKTSGFVNVTKIEHGTLLKFHCSRPSYEVGSSKKLTLKKPVESVWKLDDTVDDDIIDEDDLLDEEDLKKPDPASLRGNMIVLLN